MIGVALYHIWRLIRTLPTEHERFMAYARRKWADK